MLNMEVVIRWNLESPVIEPMNLLPRLLPLHPQLLVEVADESLRLGKQLLLAQLPGLLHPLFLLLFDEAVSLGATDEEKARPWRAALQSLRSRLHRRLPRWLRRLCNPFMRADKLGCISSRVMDDGFHGDRSLHGVLRFLLLVRPGDGGEEAGLESQSDDEDVEKEVQVRGPQGWGYERGEEEEGEKERPLCYLRRRQLLHGEPQGCEQWWRHGGEAWRRFIEQREGRMKETIWKQIRFTASDQCWAQKMSQREEEEEDKVGRNIPSLLVIHEQRGELLGSLISPVFLSFSSSLPLAWNGIVECGPSSSSSSTFLLFLLLQCTPCHDMFNVLTGFLIMIMIHSRSSRILYWC